MGIVEVPLNARWGAQTQRACLNFPISGYVMPEEFIQALGYIKYSAAVANEKLGLIETSIAQAIKKSSLKIIEGHYFKEFPVDVFQTGSATSSNMNMNEVIVHLSKELYQTDLHPNDHVNMSQSSNDVIPTAIALSSVLSYQMNLRPHLEHLIQVIEKKAQSLAGITKTGRTHLMDAMPITFGQELITFVRQLQYALKKLDLASEDLKVLAQGGTAVGTGINVHPDFPKIFCEVLSKKTNLIFKPSNHPFEMMSTQDRVVSFSSCLKNLAVSLMKMANDLRWMNSGPLAGLGEITLPECQPGSSIMPGKVNPVIPESVAMVCAHVLGTDQIITFSGQSGNFQLNVMLPLIAYHLLENIRLLGNSSLNLADKAIEDFIVNQEQIKNNLLKNPILVTALNCKIGYELGAKITKRVYEEKKPLIDIAREETNLSEDTLKSLLDPFYLTQGGINNKTIT
jgi:fumarate hydratase class II